MDVELDNKIYLGELPFPTSPSPAPLPWYKPMPAGVLEDFQFVQLSLHRFGGDEADTLVYPFCVVFVILTEG